MNGRIDQIRGKLNNYIMLALADGLNVSASDDSCLCPLGCLPRMRAKNRKRPGLEKYQELGMDYNEANNFVRGFDNVKTHDPEDEFIKLGAEYRKMFP